MTEPVLWNLDSHTAAKHRVLRSYLDGWIPVMAQQAQRVRSYGGEPRLLMIDGFAGPGRYATGQEGSPLIMLDALLSHKAFPRLADVQFFFFFIEHDGRRVDRLRDEVASLGQLPRNVSVEIAHGEFETTLGSLIDPITDSGKALIPTFAFIDPFGYSSASMSLTGRLLDFPRCEVLFFLPLSFVHRFVGRDGQDVALNSLFNTDEWREAIALSGADRRQFLLELFERQLGQMASVEHVRSFQLRTQDGNDYRLVFGLGHTKGLELAKDAMWGVDPVGGTSYTATTEAGQEVLFAPDDLVDTAPLLRELRAKFGDAWFTIEQAEECTLIDTPFRKGHLRQRTLQPAEREGVIEVQRPGSRGFRDAKLRFVD
ncbi:MAG TPA: three-Cys-motif partner protein TcmP [Thermoleophilaceae bacterium]|nr:three-Cys-motif partner protein TcmP [Thermoleophilaceae bacterium]